MGRGGRCVGLLGPIRLVDAGGSALGPFRELSRGAVGLEWAVNAVRAEDLAAGGGDSSCSKGLRRLVVGCWLGEAWPAAENRLRKAGTKVGALASRRHHV